MKLTECLSYDDVLLVPQYSDIQSRSEINIGVNLDGHHVFSLPIVASPMDTVTEAAMAIKMGKLGGMAILHRYNTIEEQVELVRNVRAELPADLPVAAAVGVTGDYLERAIAIVDNGASILCLDIAHGHHSLMKDALFTLKTNLSDDVHIMAGNVATREAFEDLVVWGADSVRVGIGGGSICSTRIQTGHGVSTLQSIIDCSKASHSSGVAIIADGGIKNSGDMVKALAAGAHMVMVGSLLAGTTETPGEIIKNKDGREYKVYRGMASKEAQMKWRGKTSSLEGISAFVASKGPLAQVVNELETGIRSGFSYSGARCLNELHANVKFIKQTNASISESSTHILKSN